MNDVKVDSIPFDEKTSTKIDFSEKINKMFGALTAPLKELKFDLKIENYVYNTNKEGFHLTYLLQTDY